MKLTFALAAMLFGTKAEKTTVPFFEGNEDVGF